VGVPAKLYRVWLEFLQIYTRTERVQLEFQQICTTNERVWPVFLQICTECGQSSGKSVQSVAGVPANLCRECREFRRILNICLSRGCTKVFPRTDKGLG